MYSNCPRDPQDNCPVCFNDFPSLQLLHCHAPRLSCWPARRRAWDLAWGQRRCPSASKEPPVCAEGVTLGRSVSARCHTPLYRTLLFVIQKVYISYYLFVLYGRLGDFVICCRCAWCSRVIGLWWWMDVGGACVRVMCGGNDVRRGCMTDVMVVCRDWLSRVADMVVDGGRRELLRVWLLSFFLPITFLVWIFDVRASVASKDCQQRLHTYC